MIEHTRYIVFSSFILVALVIVANTVGCVSMREHAPIAEGTRLTLVDSVTKVPIRGAHILHFTLLQADGRAFLAESNCRDVRYDYAGYQSMPYIVPVRKYRIWDYNFLLWLRRPARCYTTIVVYKRGYLTTLWVPGSSTEISLIRIADSAMNDKATGEGEIDWLLEWTCLSSPGRSRVYWIQEETLLGEARTLQHSVATDLEFSHILRFAIGEYKALLDSDLLSDPRAAPRLSKKIKGLREMIERE